MVALREYELIKETPMGYWISFSQSSASYWKKWVLKRSQRRFAYPTKDEAMVNFTKRTEMRIKYLKRDLRACERALRIHSPHGEQMRDENVHEHNPPPYDG